MSGSNLPLVHLNLTVADVDRSIDFYRRWFAFTGPPRTYPDGTTFLGNDDGFDLALHPSPPPTPPAPAIHFGFRTPSPDTVRRLRDSLDAGGVTITENHDTDTYVGLKCLDPDGYEIEVYWEPAQAHQT
jgi:catechol 2,3-dioxygenase-like lactoylglutathione lyase family enzyme